jgi:hypothetical protein
MYVIYCVFIVYSAFRLVSVFLSFVQSNLQFKYLFSVKFQVNSFVQSLLEFHLIIVQYSYPEIVFQVYQSCKKVTITCHLESITSNQVQDSLTFI